MIRGVKISRYGSGIAGRVLFEGVSDREPTEDEIQQAQIEAGYHPAGYGGPWYVCFEEEKGEWKVRWTCAGSCD